MLTVGEFFDIFGEEDSFALAAGLGLGYYYRIDLVLEVLSKVVILGWKGPGLRVEIILIRERFLHFIEVPRKVVFAG